LRAYRVDRGISIGELAAAIGVRRSRLVLIEAGAALMTPEQQQRVAARLNVEPSELDYAADLAPTGHGKKPV
jgi:transcriptional regulator with XRE-family HTH domain